MANNLHEPISGVATPASLPPEPPNPLTTEAFWDDQWADLAGRTWTSRLLHGRQHGRGGTFLRVMKRYVGEDVLRNASVIELGGAVSHCLLDLATWESARVAAVDYSRVGLQQTEKMFSEAGVAVRTVQADMFDWDIGEERYDLVTHWGVMEHFENPRPLLALSAALAKPGGLVVFTMPNLAARGVALWKRWAPENFAKHVYHSDEVVRQACEEAGLKVEKRFWFGPPLVRLAPWERRGVGPLLANVAHAAVSVLGTAFPGLYTASSPRLARMRGFVARKA